MTGARGKADSQEAMRQDENIHDSRESQRASTPSDSPRINKTIRIWADVDQQIKAHVFHHNRRYPNKRMTESHVLELAVLEYFENHPIPDGMGGKT